MKRFACATAVLCAGLMLAAMGPGAVAQTFKDRRERDPLSQRQLETIEVRDVTDDSVAEPAGAGAEPSSVIASNRLPATASDLPALGALGVLALGAAGALRLGRHLPAS